VALLDNSIRILLALTENRMAGLLTIRRWAAFGETGRFGGLAPFSGREEGRKNRVVPEEMSFHFPRYGSPTLHFTKYGQEP
jgi:hypothetical protein